VRVHHVALRTTDVARLEGFYAGVLGLAVVRRDPARGSVWLDAESTIVMLEPAEPGEPAVPSGTRELIAFAVEDKEAWRARLPVVEAETGHTLYFRDPDGRRVAVSDYPLTSSLTST
jgi:catechol 2,3-dioxygenase-like lactoylglutathione lyase family enzyme